MAISPLIAKTLLAVLGTGAVSAGIAVPLAKGQSEVKTLTSSPETSVPLTSPSPSESTKSPLKPLNKETFETLTNKNELEGKDCYTFFTDVKSEEVDLTSLLLFCSKSNTIDGGEETYYFWDGKDSKTAVNLKNQTGKGDILVTLEGESVPKTIFVEDDDHITNKQENISLSECRINTQAGNVDGKRIALSCKDGVSSKNVFWLEKFDFFQSN